MKSHLSPIILLCILACAAVSFAFTDSEQSKAQKKNAVQLTRVLNTAEAQYQHEKGRYGSFSELANGGYLKQTQMTRRIWPTDLNPADAVHPVPGVTCRLTLSSDGKSYQISVVGDSEPESQWAFFSDERGLIYEGQPLQ